MKQQMVKTEQIPSLDKFIFPDDRIKQYVDDLSMYYQLINQQSIELYNKWKGKQNFAGTMGQLVKLTAIRELIDSAHGKDWVVLIKAIFLLEHYTTIVDMDEFCKISPQDQLMAMDTITKGQIAYREIKKWLLPINKEDVLLAITKANSVRIGNDRYDKFQVLKFGKINSLPNENNSVKIYPHILEIDNPTALVQYFKNLKEPVYDSLIITFMRHQKHSFKTSVYLFFIWKGIFYILDLSERRLNIDNPAGERNPDKYLDRMFGDVFLPVDVFLDKKKSKAKDLVVRNQNIFKRETIDNVFTKSPEIKAWVNMFLYRVIDYIENNQNKIKLGVSSLDLVKELEDKLSTKIKERVKIEKFHSSFQSSDDASSYLIRKYSNKITSVVVSENALPMVIGTRKHLENLIEYKKRDEVAKNLQQLIIKDFNKNHKNVYKWFRDFVKKQDKNNLVQKALEDEEYEFKYYGSISTDFDGKECIQGNWFKYDKSKKLQKVKILTVYDVKTDHIPYDEPDDPLNITLTRDNSLYSNYRKKHVCVLCRKFKWSVIVEINFIDYRQICKFFNLNQLDLPKEYVEHFHYQNEADVGNSRLDDTDPVDEVHDLWFRENSEFRSGVTFNNYSSEHPHFDIRIPLCRRCFKKNGGVENADLE